MPVDPGVALPTAPPVARPRSKPVPVLQANGFSGDIHDFNDRVQAVVDSHRHGLGYDPSPALVLSVTRNADPAQYPALFSVTSNAQAQAKSVLAAHKAANPYDYFITRPDGIVQPDNPLLHLLHPELAAPQPPQAPKAPAQLTAAEYEKKYPMVAAGSLPIADANAFYHAISFLNSPVPTPTSNAKLAAIDPLSQYTGVTTQDTQQARRAVLTISQAQQELNKEMGTSLPVTGTINDTWVKALSNWTRSKDYFAKQVAFDAQASGFGTNTGAYIKAWHAKQAATSHGLWGQFMQAMPLPLFGHGGFWQDLASLPGYLKGSSSNPLNIGLHGLTRSAGLTLDTVGGTVSQVKADMAAGNTFAAYMIGLHGKGLTYDEALSKAREQLHANPTWLRAFGGGFVPVNEKGFLANLDQGLLNPAGDLILLRKASFTGERVAAGDLAVAKNSTYLNTAARWSYQDLVKYGSDGIGRAASRLEGGQGTRALVARAAPLVKQGLMSQEQFANHVAELYATGRTEVAMGDKVATVTGPTLTSLRTAKLPTPGKAGQWLTAQKNGLREWADAFDAKTRGSNSALNSRAGDFVATLRSAVAHAAPQGGRLGYFQDILPERVFNFVVKHKLGDDTYALANKLESDLVRFQGKENIRGIQSVEQQIKQLYHEKYGRQGTEVQGDPFTALVETEAPSVFKFPGGQEPKTEDALKSIETFTQKVNAGLNKAAKVHARIILSGANPLTGLGGFSLFWKHSIGDGLRAVVGGIGDALTPEVRAAKKELAGMAAKDPELARRYGALLDRMRGGEANWALNRGGWNITTESFRTGEKLDSRSHMTAAGEFLRRQLDSKALLASQDGSLVQLILHDKEFRGLWKSLRKNNPDLSAEDYAALIEQRYKTIGEAFQAKGLSFDDATAVLRENAGHDAGPALGEWIKRNELDFPVDHGQVETRGTFDDLTGRWVGNVIMRPNKFWRSNFGETVLAKHYSILKGAGFPDREAFDVASQVAEKTVKYHMLDFANRLQVEQDLRWLSYFATKHRLYWKWVASTFVRNPRYAAAVADFHDTLNKHGGISLPFTVLGQKWQIPLERLVWVPGREYDETAPLAVGVFNFIKSGGSLDAAIKGATGTSGNILTRSDTATFLGTKLLKIHMGMEAPTYRYAVAGLDKQTGDRITRALNEYQLEYMKEHGHYANESTAVKTVLLHQLGQEYWRANLPLPVVPDVDRTDQQQLLAQYMALIDPKARAKFLDDHPGFSDHFGVYQDPKRFLHDKEFYQRWTNALDAYHSARRDLYAQAKKAGEWSIPLEQKRRELNVALQNTRNKLLVDDAHSAGVDTKGGVPNGTTIPYGPWGKLVNKDPQFDPAHFLSATFPKLQGQQGDIIGPLQKSLQNELTLLSDPQYVKANVQTPEEVKTLKREILQKLEVFKAYPTDALGKIRDTYQTVHVNKYWAAYDAKVTAIKTMPSDKRSAADSAFRAWRDQQDHPVTINGIQFPSPVRMAWAMLDPKTRQEREAYLASKPFTSLANYELDLLGVKHPANVSAALAAIDAAKVQYRKDYPGQSISKQQLAAVWKSLDKQPGYGGSYSYYVNTLSQPRIRQFEKTSLYQEMPAKQKFDQVIGQAALQVADGIKANGQSSYYRAEWAKAMETQILPWLNLPENKDLRDYLTPFGPNFLNQLVG
jgi:hypothetical protein